jgi:drug/metabolite transporter (DMT)-like permease
VTSGRSWRVTAERWIGVGAIVVAILCFSVSSTLVKLADTPGAAIAFWRMVLAIVVWWAILLFRRERVSWSEIRSVWLIGVLFGANIALFFTGVTRTSIANAEFIGSLTPLVLVPIGVLAFHERLHVRALAFGSLAIVGVAIVLFNSPPSGTATWQGNVIVGMAVATWAGYLVSVRRVRSRFTVAQLLAAITPIAALTVLPVVLVRHEATSVSAKGWAYIVLLTFLTGVGAHGLVVFAQHHVPLGTISVMQVAQPALAVVWAFVLLGEEVEPVQLIGMVLVLAGLTAFTVISHRSTAPLPAAPELSPAGEDPDPIR